MQASHLPFQSKQKLYCTAFLIFSIIFTDLQVIRARFRDTCSLSLLMIQVIKDNKVS